MKKTFLLAIIFSLFTVSLVNFTPHLSVSAEMEPIFARVKYNNVYLYKTPDLNEEVDNVYFLLEKSYFIKITSQVNDVFFEATYMDIDGFVKQSEIEFAETPPQNPYLSNITFNTNPTSSVVLRSVPSSSNTDETAIKVLPPNTENIVYYGKITGQEVVAGLGNIWYYAKYTDDQNKIVYGYVYSPLTYNLTPITPNTEASTLTNFEDLDQINTYLNISSNFKFIIIVLVVLPTFLILYLFFKPIKTSD